MCYIMQTQRVILQTIEQNETLAQVTRITNNKAVIKINFLNMTYV